MKADELYKEVIDKIKVNVVHPLHKAILEECCEHAINSNMTNTETRVNAVLIAFNTSNSTLQGTMMAGLKLADSFTLNYRGQTFVIERGSKLLGD